VLSPVSRRERIILLCSTPDLLEGLEQVLPQMAVEREYGGAKKHSMILTYGHSDQSSGRMGSGSRKSKLRASCH
jgi:hypothetical protein